MMVSFKSLLLLAVAAVGVLAEDPDSEELAAKAYWNQAFDPATPPASGQDTSPEKRDIVHSPRNFYPIFKNPYSAFWCKAPFTKPAKKTKCNRNDDCFRSFLNGRHGEKGKVCSSHR
jgi:hypothetical protein